MTRSPVRPPRVALIDEQACIGCTLCIEACPVDAIVGAAKLMHTVIAAECTGCKRCLPPCPVDCISMVESGEPLTREERKRRSAQYKSRNRARRARLERVAARPEQGAQRKKLAMIESAMQRARQRLRERHGKA